MREPKMLLELKRYPKTPVPLSVMTTSLFFLPSLMLVSFRMAMVSSC